MENCAASAIQIEMAGVSLSSEIVEGSPPGQHALLQQDVAASEMSVLPTENKSEDFVSIDMPPSANAALENVNLFASTLELSVGSSSNRASSSRGMGSNEISELENGSLNIEEAAILALGGLHNPPNVMEQYSVLRSSSVTTQVESFSRARSLPSSRFQLVSLNSTDESCIARYSIGVEEQQAIYRSRSVPVGNNNGTIRENQVRVLYVVPCRRTPEGNVTSSSSPFIHNGEQHQDDITEEEAVCRICFEELADEQESFKLQCHCRGDLSLVHRECSQRWFGLRGNNTCEICMTEVQNIIVRIARRSAADPSSSQNLPVQQPAPVTEVNRLWQEIPFLLVASIVGYFMTIKLFQMGRKSNEALHELYDIPASCILGVLATLVASSFAQESLMWIYALAQYTIFLICSQIFYILLYFETIPTIVYSAALAMGISRGARPFYRIIKKVREVWRNRLNNNSQDSAQPTDTQPVQETAESHQSEAGHRASNE